MALAILILWPGVGRGLQLSRPLKSRISLDLHKYLGSRGTKSHEAERSPKGWPLPRLLESVAVLGSSWLRIGHLLICLRGFLTFPVRVASVVLLALLNKGPNHILSVHELFCLIYELLEGRGGVLWVSSFMNGLLDQIPLRSVAKTTLSSWSSTESFSLFNLTMKSLRVSVLPILGGKLQASSSFDPR